MIKFICALCKMTKIEPHIRIILLGKCEKSRNAEMALKYLKFQTAWVKIYVIIIIERGSVWIKNQCSVSVDFSLLPPIWTLYATEVTSIPQTVIFIRNTVTENLPEAFWTLNLLPKHGIFSKVHLQEPIISSTLHSKIISIKINKFKVAQALPRLP